MKYWIIAIASVLAVCLLLGMLCYVEFGTFNFVRLGMALTETLGGEGVYLVAEEPEAVWLVGTRGGLDAFDDYLRGRGWLLRMDEQMGARIPVEKDGTWDYVYWSVNAMYHKFTWETRGDPARTAAPSEPAALHVPEDLTHTAYFYPERATDLMVAPHQAPTFAYPAPGAFTARPEGILTGAAGVEYDRLHWKTASGDGFSMEEGFCVAGADTAAFLEDALPKLGLNRREANDMILCFLPRMQENAWNLISFHTGSGLSVEPAPDTGIQVCMIYKALSAPVEIGQQTLTAADRSGFTVVQWCGGEVK